MALLSALAEAFRDVFALFHGNCAFFTVLETGTMIMFLVHSIRVYSGAPFATILRSFVLRVHQPKMLCQGVVHANTPPS